MLAGPGFPWPKGRQAPIGRIGRRRAQCSPLTWKTSPIPLAEGASSPHQPRRGKSARRDALTGNRLHAIFEDVSGLYLWGEHIPAEPRTLVNLVNHQALYFEM